VLISSRVGLLQAVMHLTRKHSPFAHQSYDTFISTCFAQLFCDVPGISHLICFAFFDKTMLISTTFACLRIGCTFPSPLTFAGANPPLPSYSVHAC
jgi:hypothetical protein